MKIKNLINWKIFGILFCAGIFSFFAVLPYILTLQADVLKDLPISLPLAILLSMIQTSVLLAVVIFLGLIMSRKNGFKLPLLEGMVDGGDVMQNFKTKSILSIKLGALAGVLIIIFDYIFSFFIEPFKSLDIAIWKSFLGAFYGGIFEEILLRLFFLSLLVWIFSKVLKTSDGIPRTSVIWSGIIIAAVVFGLGHLPATALLTSLTPLVIARAILLNSIGGIIFGWLYWKKGLVSAMMAHFTADIIILVVYPVLIGLF
jgi:membrane protease YdiL (CAAX protease family)